MRIAFVYNEIPNKEHSTDLYNAWLLLEFFQKQGIEINVVLFLSEKNRVGDPATRRRWLAELMACNYKVTLLPADEMLVKTKSSLLPFFSSGVEDFFPETGFSGNLNRLLAAMEPDLIFIWGNWPAVASVFGIRCAPKFAFVGDLPHFPQYYRLQPPFVSASQRHSISWWQKRWKLKRLEKATVKLLADFDRVAATSHHYADWLKVKNIQAEWLPNFVPDFGGITWQERRSKKSSTAPLKLMLLGHLETTANYAGILFFVNEMMPALEQKLSSAVEVHICGKGKLPPAIESKLAKSWIRRRGFVEDLESELLDTDVFLVPTPIELGIRVRIPYAWSAGCCVVTHTANQKGLTELCHGENALMAATGKELVEQIIKLQEDPACRKRLSEGGRKTFENHFSYAVVGKQLLTQVCRVARQDLQQKKSQEIFPLKEESVANEQEYSFSGGKHG